MHTCFSCGRTSIVGAGCKSKPLKDGCFVLYLSMPSFVNSPMIRTTFSTILLLTVISLFSNGTIAAEPVTTGTNPVRTATDVNAPALFDGQRAMADLVRQVEAGPRLPDSPGLAATRQLIESTLAENGFTVGHQDFTVKSPLLGTDVQGQNLFGVYPKGAPVKYIISAHYDTRPYADQDPNPAMRQMPVPGANDGASGVAVLLELARSFPKANPAHGVALVFFDVEDHGDAGSAGGFCLGSRNFATNLPVEVKDFEYGINLDMVGDADLKLPMEGYSLAKAPKLTFDLWRTGNVLFPSVWLKERGPSIYDDHISFHGAGKQFIDVIDFDYPAWHTTQDTPDKCSPSSLDFVGDTILSFILH
jgi:hypothetical protein